MTRKKWIVGSTVSLVLAVVIAGWALLFTRDRPDHAPTSPSVAARSQVAAPSSTSATNSQADACREITTAVTASFVLADDDAQVGEHLFPRVTAHNRGDDAVVLQFTGVGRATSSVGSGVTVAWGEGRAGRLVIPSHGHRISDLSGDASGTLSVGTGDHVDKAVMRAVASTTVGEITECSVKVPRSSASTTTTCGTADKQDPGAFTGVWLSVENRGQNQDDAKAVQEQLNALGYQCTPADGDYGNETAQLVRDFQRDRGIPTDGKVGPQTWAALFGYAAPASPAKTAPPEPDATAPYEPDATAAPSASDFDRTYAVEIAGDIFEDIKTVDHRLNDGIGVSSALDLLSDSYGRHR